ncbi:hypothetical protein T11_9530, partial [Trichinella zimbabwensis]
MVHASLNYHFDQSSQHFSSIDIINSGSFQLSFPIPILLIAY